MRNSLLPVVFAAAVAVAAIPPASAQDWSRVQALKPGVTVSVKTKSQSTTCHVVSVDADSITCAKVPQPIARTDIRKVTIHRRALSGLIGFGALGGIGAAIGAGISNPDALFGRGFGALVFAVPLAVIGAIVGVATDFAHSTLYNTH